MDHMGGNIMALGVLAAVAHRNRTGEGQWVDMSCTEAGLTLAGPDLLDYTVNKRPLRRPGLPDSNHSRNPAMAPHGIYPTREADRWLAIACRDDRDWQRLGTVIGEAWVTDDRWAHLAGRLAGQDDLDALVEQWSTGQDRFEVVNRLRHEDVPAAIVALPEERIEHDPATSEWGLWPEVHHPDIGRVRVDGVPVHLSETDWVIQRGAPRLGQHNAEVFGSLLGLSADEIDGLAQEGVI
jgi:crotonobetainyl-CoA:carnitine CoA-transferase CaiB-like acyl-CoA transferase